VIDWRNTSQEVSLLEELRHLREQRGWSQAKLAQESGVDRATINQVEGGRRSPTIATLQALAAALGAELGDFFPKGQAPLPLDTEQRRKSSEVLRAPDEPYITAEMLHERSIPANDSEIIVLNQYIHAREHPPVGPYAIGHVTKEGEPVDHERVKTLLAYVLAAGMLTQDETEAARDALQRELAVSYGV
jgi:transcriptional regulator with XRE-family HTH domain